MNVREKLNALKDITEAQQQYGTRRLYDLGIIYDDHTIEGVNDNIPKMVARIDDDITSLEYAWSSQKITDNLSTNLAGYYTKSEVDTALENKADTSTLGTAAAKDVPTSGDASSSQVVMGDDSRLSDARTPTAHNQASNTITAMTGYSKPSSTSAITVNDTLNEAIGKLEKGIESSGGSQAQADWSQTDTTATDFIKNKPTIGTAAAKDVPTSGNATSSQVVMGNDSRLSNSRTPTAHNQASNTINAMTGYSKPSSTSAISTSDTLNQAIGKLEMGIEAAAGGSITLVASGSAGASSSPVTVEIRNGDEYRFFIVCLAWTVSSGTPTSTSYGKYMYYIVDYDHLVTYLPSSSSTSGALGHNIATVPYKQSSSSSGLANFVLKGYKKNYASINFVYLDVVFDYKIYGIK